MVEFALILFPLLLIVAGIIQFGIGLNFWLDINRIANQGARWAAVNCGPPSVEANVCDVGAGGLQGYLERQAISQGNDLTGKVTICYEVMSGTGGEATTGDPVRVEITQPFTFVPIVELGTVDLVASATMRLEQRPTKGGLDAFGLCP